MKASQYPEAAFLATMTASATHELRNILAIIKESAGLIEDMIRVFAQNGMLDNEKVFRAVSRIEAQVRRGADLLTNLNRLSHALDSDLATVDLNTEVEQVAFLSQRFARNRGHQIIVHPTEGGARTSVHPLHLHMALFSALECSIEELPEGAEVVLAVEVRDGFPTVEVRGVSEEGKVVGPSDGEGWSRVRDWADSLGGAFERSETGFGVRILLPPEGGG
jgi:signal transduction histidine kinase